ncbi:hypothetical protein HK17_11580 [Acetobacter indonesiensis]|uniref:Uncharacterized protein n=1 Tax=Acetobacter indonesiensis TaxID=104101 RepID=A0A252ANQ4_9PROT|nr:hypothetical protein HK17_11580 [Acetobacter indonesiensis]
MIPLHPRKNLPTTRLQIGDRISLLASGPTPDDRPRFIRACIALFDAGDTMRVSILDQASPLGDNALADADMLESFDIDLGKRHVTIPCHYAWVDRDGLYEDGSEFLSLEPWG